MTAAIKRVGFIGTGVMGASMAGHLLDAGYDVVVHSRTRHKAEGLLAAGARWAQTAGEASTGVDAVVSIVGYPDDVEQVYLGEGGVVERAKPGTVLIDMTTSSPALARRIADAAVERGLLALDAPVSGGDVGARNATLTIMVGGSEEAFERAAPLLSVLGPNVVLQGEAGAGQYCKMANQIAIAGSMFATVELIAYARAVGLDPERVLRSVTAGSAASWSLANLAPRILRGDMAPGFFVKHFIKDLRIALDSAEEAGVELPATRLAEQMYSRLAEHGGADLGTQALSLLYETSNEQAT